MGEGNMEGDCFEIFKKKEVFNESCAFDKDAEKQGKQRKEYLSKIG